VGCLNISFIASALKPGDAATRYLSSLVAAAGTIQKKL